MLACGVGIRRDYSTIPAGQVGFDDLCGLQDYFDTIEARWPGSRAWSAASTRRTPATSASRAARTGSPSRPRSSSQPAPRAGSELGRLPESLATAERIDLEVHWSGKAGFVVS